MEISIWFPVWYGFYFTRLDPEQNRFGLLYEWAIGFGYFEIAKRRSKQKGQA